MGNKIANNPHFHATALVAAALLYAAGAAAAPGNLANSPLFTGTSAKPNILLAIDDSGSMDFEVLFPSNDGALWWENTSTVRSFVGQPTAGKVNFEADDKYVYLFPNGTGNGNRIYADSTHDHFAIPPFAQYAFARSPDYNKAYYDPAVTYEPWLSYGTTNWGDIDPTSAPSDPNYGTYRFNLTVTTTDAAADTNNFRFRLLTGMRIPKNTRYKNWSTGNWTTAAADVTMTSDQNVAIPYYPAVYYVKTTTGTYQLTSTGASKSCGATPDPANYTAFHTSPGTFVSTDVDALGPDGACLKKHVIAAGSAEMQNFANWFSYYRKRHLALRAGMPPAFDGMSGIRTGVFTINNRNTVTMRDFDTQKDTFFSDLFDIHGNSGGTPNREALKHAGDQYKRTDANAPITESCQKNFTILFTDGYAVTADTGVGNQDGDKGSPYADTYDHTLADIAMKYYTENLRADISPTGDVPVPSGCSVSPLDPSLDCNTNLHMNTYGVGLGQSGTIFGQTISGITYDSVAKIYSNPLAWPDANADRDPTQIDDLYHAAVNGRGTMSNADTPEQLRDRMTQALKSILAQVGSAASVTFNTGELDTNSAVYLALFDSSHWSGDLLAYALNSTTGAVSSTASWSAATLLDARNISSNPRTILTHDGTEGVAFQWANLTDAQKNDLRTNSTGGTDSDTIAQARLNYVRGSRADEGAGNNFRVRSSRLGDMVHSSPVFVGKPELGWPDHAPFPSANGERYTDFRDAQASRTGVIYAGANDGMLHAFLAEDSSLGAGDGGTELLAYIPSSLFSTAANEGLHALTETDYSHRFYVDLLPTVSDVYVNGEWKTVLIGGERAGGRGMFALDVTDPSQFDESNADSLVLWEFSSADDADLGYTFSIPTVALTNAIDGSGNHRWAVIFGNGYNDTGSGEATLYVLFLDADLSDGWTLNTDYLKFSTGAGSPSDLNGLSTPAVVDLDGNGTADRVYAGDLQGHMWAFDLCNESSGACQGTGWGIAHVDASSNPAPLFTAASNQPITGAAVVVKHPTVLDNPSPSNAPNVLVLFGTGQYMVDGDRTSSDTQSFYGVWDEGTGSLDRNNLVEQTFEPGFPSDVRVPTDNPVDYEGTGGTVEYGWYMDLPATGERVVTDPVVRGTIVYFNTTIPSTDPCAYGGSGWLMSVNFENGGRPDTAIFDYNNDGYVNSGDLLDDSSGTLTSVAPGGQRFDQGLPASPTFLGNKQYTPGTRTETGAEINIREVEHLSGANIGRLSWEELGR